MRFFRLQKLNRNKIAYCCIRRCSLVLSASLLLLLLLLLVLVLALLLVLLASAAAASATAAAAALQTAGWSCSVFFCFLPTLLRKLHSW